jgi:hypothetical protein
MPMALYSTGSVTCWRKFLCLARKLKRREALSHTTTYWRNVFVACEEAQEKRGTFTYSYLLVAFTMFKWTLPAGAPLVLVDKVCMEKMFEPWHSRADLENIVFNNSMFSKW